MSEPKLPDLSDSAPKNPAPLQKEGRRQPAKSLKRSWETAQPLSPELVNEGIPDSELAWIPDARDGLTRAERVVLWVLHEAKRDFPNRNVPTATIYGRVVEYMDMSVEDLQRILQRLVGIR